MIKQLLVSALAAALLVSCATKNAADIRRNGQSADGKHVWKLDIKRYESVAGHAR